MFDTSLAVLVIVCAVVCLFDDEDYNSYKTWWSDWKTAWCEFAERRRAGRESR